MRLKWTLLVASLATTGLANATELKAEDLSGLTIDPQDVLESLAPNSKEIQSGVDGRRDRGLDRDYRRPRQMPKSCTDAAIKDDQKAAIEAAVLDAKREKIKVGADLKVAMMDYARTASDQNSEKATADELAAKIADGAQKLTAIHVGLATRIIYDLVTPEQRKNTFNCLMELHKKHKKCKHGKKGLPGDTDDDDKDDQDEDDDKD